MSTRNDLTAQERDREAAYKASKNGGRMPALGTLEIPIHCTVETEMGPTIPRLQEEAWRIAEDHGFHREEVTVGDRLMLIVSEAAEALEAFREGHKPNECWYEGKDGTKPCGVPSEIADIIIRCFDFAACYDIDLETIILEKMDYNRTRPFMHGKTL